MDKLADYRGKRDASRTPEPVPPAETPEGAIPEGAPARGEAAEAQDLLGVGRRDVAAWSLALLCALAFPGHGGPRPTAFFAEALRPGAVPEGLRPDRLPDRDRFRQAKVSYWPGRARLSGLPPPSLRLIRVSSRQSPGYAGSSSTGIVFR